MVKKLSFLGVFVSFFVSLFTTNSFAEGTITPGGSGTTTPGGSGAITVIDKYTIVVPLACPYDATSNNQTIYYWNKDFRWHFYSANQVTTIDSITPPKCTRYMYEGYPEYIFNGSYYHYTKSSGLSASMQIIEKDGTLLHGLTGAETNLTLTTHWLNMVTFVKECGETRASFLAYNDPYETLGWYKPNLLDKNKPIKIAYTPQKIDNTPECTGYKFDGYYTAITGGSRVVKSNGEFNAGYKTNKQQGATTVYAHWTPNTYKVELLNGDEGSGFHVEKTIYAVYNTGWATDKDATTGTLSQITPPTKPHAEFTGYYTDSGKKIINADGTFAEENPTFTAEETTLKANYRPVIYTIDLNPNGGRAKFGSELARAIRVTAPGIAPVTVTYDVGLTMNGKNAYMIPAANLPVRDSINGGTTAFEFDGYWQNPTFIGTQVADLGQEYVNSAGYILQSTMKTFKSPAYANWRVRCAAGYYLHAGDNVCQPCTAGSYCPGNMFSTSEAFKVSSTADQGLSSCPRGFTNSAKGAQSATDCYRVTDAERYVASNNAFNQSCLKGYYCPGGIKVYYGSTGGATICGANSYTAAFGQTACTSCPSGWSIEDDGKDATQHNEQSDCKKIILLDNNGADLDKNYTPALTCSYGVECTLGEVVSYSREVGSNQVGLSWLGSAYRATGGWGKTPTCSNTGVHDAIALTNPVADKYFACKAYCVTFDGNGGTDVTNVPGAVYASYGKAMPAIAKTTPTRTGYVFDGWYDAATGGEQYYDANNNSAKKFDKTDAPVTLYAHWTLQKYDIVYEPGDNAYLPTDRSGCPSTYTYNTQATINCTPTRLGFEFAGWCEDSGLTNCHEGEFSFPPEIGYARSAKLYAKWTLRQYTFTYDCNDGTNKKVTRSMSYGSTFTVPSLEFIGCTAPENRGFVGWHVPQTGQTWQSGTQQTFDRAQNMTLVAQYDNAPQIERLKIVSDGETDYCIYANISAPAGSQITKVMFPTRKASSSDWETNSEVLPASNEYLAQTYNYKYCQNFGDTYSYVTEIHAYAENGTGVTKTVDIKPVTVQFALTNPTDYIISRGTVTTNMGTYTKNDKTVVFAPNRCISGAVCEMEKVKASLTTGDNKFAADGYEDATTWLDSKTLFPYSINGSPVVTSDSAVTWIPQWYATLYTVNLLGNTELITKDPDPTTLYYTYRGNVYADDKKTTQINYITPPTVKAGYTFNGYKNSDGQIAISASGGGTRALTDFLPASGTTVDLTPDFVPSKYTVTYKCDNSDTVWETAEATYNTEFTAAAAETCPAPENYVFDGWAVSGTTETHSGNAKFTWDYTEDKTFTPKWRQVKIACEAGTYYTYSTKSQQWIPRDCESGYYCPGVGTTGATTGCRETCPANDGDEMPRSKENSSSVSDCYTYASNVREGNSVFDKQCYYNSTNGDYNTDCNIEIIACMGGYYRAQENATTCTAVGVGYYSMTGELERHSCADLQTNPDDHREIITAKDIFDSAITDVAAGPTRCAAVCTEKEIDHGLLRPGNPYAIYTGEKYQECSFLLPAVCDKGYKASRDGRRCELRTPLITLNHKNGTSNTVIYAQYDSDAYPGVWAWYSDANATNKITSVAVPTNGDAKAFAGYYTSTGDLVIDSDGNIVASPSLDFGDSATITASYTDRTPQTCPAGKYYSGTGTTCTTCPAGSYCSGVTTYVGVGSAKGIESCPQKGYTHAGTAPGETVVSSAEGSIAKTACYATNVKYSAANGTEGYQTCHYNSGKYNNQCTDITVTACGGGYYIKKANATQCEPVGDGYYRANTDSVTTRHACPRTSGYTPTTTGDGNATSIQQCLLEGFEFTIDGMYGRQRRSCYHQNADSPNTNSIEGYTYNCQIQQLVQCEAGYYDDGKTTKNLGDYKNVRVCVRVTDENSYSVGYNDKLAAPTSPDKSTEQQSCPFKSDILINGAKIGERRRADSVSAMTLEDFGMCYYKAGTCPVGNIYDSDIDDGNGAQGSCRIDNPDECPANSYCDIDPNTGKTVQTPCPDGGKSAKGTQDITKCYKTSDVSGFLNGSGSQTCNYDTGSGTYSTCTVTEDTVKCNAGYYYKSSGSAGCDTVGDNYYSPADDRSQTECPTGTDVKSVGTKSAITDCQSKCAKSKPANAVNWTAKSEYVAYSGTGYSQCEYTLTCELGYDVKDNGTENPVCVAREYNVTLAYDNGTGESIKKECTIGTTCDINVGPININRTGYTFSGQWCTSTEYTECYGTTFNPANNQGENVTLHAKWLPNIITVKLMADDELFKTVYLKYATGWYNDANAEYPITQIGAVPKKAGYEFAGYKHNNIQIVDGKGDFVTSEDALISISETVEIKAEWSKGNVTCEKGTYYSGTGITCLPCADNHYCPGVTVATDSGQAGLNRCRDGGKTVKDAHAAEETQCYKENLETYTSPTGKGSGTQSCYFDGTTGYSDRCFDQKITACAGGYYRGNATDKDCKVVGEGFYSIDSSMERQSCPGTGTTSITNAATPTECFATVSYSAMHGSGEQRCFYAFTDGANEAVYNTNCDTKTINSCEGGYWLDASKTTEDCSVVGYDYYSEGGDTDRTPCPQNGTTNREDTSVITSCKKDDTHFESAHGKGTQVCYWSISGEAYNSYCNNKSFSACNAGYYFNGAKNTDDCIEVGYGYYSPDTKLDRTSCGVSTEGLTMTTDTPTSASVLACKTCPAGSVCSPEDPDNPTPTKPQTCASLTGGKYPNSDAGTITVNECWRECAIAANAATMRGHDYYGIASTCEIEHCKAGYTYNASKKTCEICPEGTFCGAGADTSDCPAGQNCDNAPKQCADLGSGEWSYSETGATGPNGCYRKCEGYAITGGTAVPVNSTENYPNQCQFKGFDEDQNPCEIVKGACVVTSCKSSFEMVNGKCQACNRDHAISYKSTGNCMVETCTPGWHPFGQKCEANQVSCTVPNAKLAQQQWNYQTNSYGVCTVQECDDGYHISSNACVKDVQECAIEHGTGIKEWNNKTNTWGECVATSCDPGFTNDKSDTNEPTKQCGNCRNKFGVNGELAASSYSRGCTISACMYQGEMYNLENNECVPICDVNGYEDETGSMKWNPVTHKCERTCKEGYIMW